MSARARYVTVAAIFTAMAPVAAQERIELESIYVKGNKEFPQTLYVVPWKDVKGKNREEQPLVLHSLYGDLFDPVSETNTPAAASERQTSAK